MSWGVPARVRRLIDNFLGDSGTTTLALRRSAFDRAYAFGSGAASQPPVADGLVEWVDRIAVSPSTASDDDIERLKAAGYSEDDIIEITKAVARCEHGASRDRIPRHRGRTLR